MAHKFFPQKAPDDLSSHAHRQFIGILGLLLPVLLWYIAGTRPIVGLPHWSPLTSISSYYYSGAVAVFVGVLIALAVFFFTYRGYDNEYQARDRAAAGVAGVAAVFVAFFPTTAPLDRLRADWWSEGMRTVHYAAAITLFASLIFFTLVLFPKSNVKGTPLPRDKKTRNVIYRVCGAAMALCMVWAGSALVTDGPIFWAEALALEFFAASWLVKGHADETAIAIAKRSMGVTKSLFRSAS